MKEYSRIEPEAGTENNSAEVVSDFFSAPSSDLNDYLDLENIVAAGDSSMVFTDFLWSGESPDSPSPEADGSDAADLSLGDGCSLHSSDPASEDPGVVYVAVEISEGSTAEDVPLDPLVAPPDGGDLPLDASLDPTADTVSPDRSEIYVDEDYTYLDSKAYYTSVTCEVSYYSELIQTELIQIELIQTELIQTELVQTELAPDKQDLVDADIYEGDYSTEQATSIEASSLLPSDESIADDPSGDSSSDSTPQIVACWDYNSSPIEPPLLETPELGTPQDPIPYDEGIVISDNPDTFNYYYVKPIFVYHEIYHPPVLNYSFQTKDDPSSSGELPTLDATAGNQFLATTNHGDAPADSFAITSRPQGEAIRPHYRTLSVQPASETSDGRVYATPVLGIAEAPSTGALTTATDQAQSQPQVQPSPSSAAVAIAAGAPSAPSPSEPTANSLPAADSGPDQPADSLTGLSALPFAGSSAFASADPERPLATTAGSSETEAPASLLSNGGPGESPSNPSYDSSLLASGVGELFISSWDSPSWRSPGFLFMPLVSPLITDTLPG
jgi:hypothetical protein